MDKLKIIIYIFLVLLLAQTSGFCDSIYDIFNIKSGRLTGDETWSGKILLIGDVLVPVGKTLTILPDTWLVFNDVDINNLGRLKDRPEIIAEGTIASPTSTINSIQILNMSDKKVQDYLDNNITLTTVNISPKEVNVTPLKKEWRAYKHQYARWAMIFSMGLLY